MTSKNNQSTVRTSTTAWTSSGLGGVFVSLSNFIPEEYRTYAYILIPILSPALSFIGVILYCKYIESPELVSLRAKLKRDLKYQKKIIKDKYVPEATKKKALKNYSETLLLLANLGREEINGAINIPAVLMPDISNDE